MALLNGTMSVKLEKHSSQVDIKTDKLPNPCNYYSITVGVLY